MLKHFLKQVTNVERFGVVWGGFRNAQQARKETDMRRIDDIGNDINLLQLAKIVLFLFLETMQFCRVVSSCSLLKFRVL